MIATTPHYLFHNNYIVNNIMSIPTSIGNNLNKIIIFFKSVHITITIKQITNNVNFHIKYNKKVE
jgi:hypothetical protein